MKEKPPSGQRGSEATSKRLGGTAKEARRPGVEERVINPIL